VKPLGRTCVCAPLALLIGGPGNLPSPGYQDHFRGESRPRPDSPLASASDMQSGLFEFMEFNPEQAQNGQDLDHFCKMDCMPLAKMVKNASKNDRFRDLHSFFKMDCR
jgi:hypothetical protein